MSSCATSTHLNANYTFKLVLEDTLAHSHQVTSFIKASMEYALEGGLVDGHG